MVHQHHATSGPFVAFEERVVKSHNPIIVTKEEGIVKIAATSEGPPDYHAVMAEQTMNNTKPATENISPLSDIYEHAHEHQDTKRHESDSNEIK